MSNKKDGDFYTHLFAQLPNGITVTSEIIDRFVSQVSKLQKSLHYLSSQQP